MLNPLDYSVIMQTITILVFLAMIAVASAVLCCKTGGFCADYKGNFPPKASDSKAKTSSMPTDISSILKMKEAKSSVPNAETIPAVSALKVKSQEAKIETKAPIATAEPKAPVSTEKILTPVASTPAKTPETKVVSRVPKIDAKAPIANTKQSVPEKVTIPVVNAQTKQQTPVVNTPAKPSVSATKVTIPVTSAQTKQTVPAKVTIPVVNNQAKPTVSNSPAKTSDATAKYTTPVARAQERATTPAQKTQSKPTVVPLAKATPQVQKTQASTSGLKPQPSVPTQVLVLNVLDTIDARLNLERKLGEKLNWSFICVDGFSRNLVKAHKSVVLNYSPFLQNLLRFRTYENSFVLYYPANIVESIVTLMYQQVVTIKKSDYAKIMEVARKLQMNTMISVLQDDVTSPGYRR